MLPSVLILILSHHSSSQSVTVGKLFVVNGSAWVTGNPDQATQRVQFCRANDEIEVSPHSEARVWLLQSGKRFQLSSPSTVKIVNGSLVALKGASPKALAKVGSGITAVFQYSAAQAAVVVRDRSFRITPTGGLIKAPATISWEADRDANSYDVNLAESKSSEPAIHVEGITKTSVSIPAGALRPGKLYRLTLTSNMPGASMRSFRTLWVLSPSELARLSKAVSMLDAKYAGSPELLLVKADMYEQYGLYKNCLECLTKFKASHPSESLSQEISRITSLAEGRM